MSEVRRRLRGFWSRWACGRRPLRPCGCVLFAWEPSLHFCRRSRCAGSVPFRSNRCWLWTRRRRARLKSFLRLSRTMEGPSSPATRRLGRPRYGVCCVCVCPCESCRKTRPCPLWKSHKPSLQESVCLTIRFLAPAVELATSSISTHISNNTHTAERERERKKERERERENLNQQDQV